MTSFVDIVHLLSITLFWIDFYWRRAAFIEKNKKARDLFH